MSVQIYIFETINHVPWILVARQSEYNLKKMKVACPILKYYAHCQILVITLKSSGLQCKKSTTQKYHHWSFNLS